MSAANFDACNAFTLKYEGGKSDDPRDPGGRTMQGVTQRTYNAHRKKQGKGLQDVYLMKPAERDEIYRSGYWAAVGGDRLRSGEDLVTYDFGVNSGPARALKVLAATKAQTNDLHAVISGVTDRRLSFLHGLSTWSHFGKGWGARVAACEALAYKMAYGQALAPSVIASKKESAKAKQKTQKSVAVGHATGGGAAVTSDQWLHGWQSGIVICLLVAFVLLAVVYAFKAYQQSLRVAALDAQLKGPSRDPLPLRPSALPKAPSRPTAPPRR